MRVERDERWIFNHVVLKNKNETEFTKVLMVSGTGKTENVTGEEELSGQVDKWANPLHGRRPFRVG